MPQPAHSQHKARHPLWGAAEKAPQWFQRVKNLMGWSLVIELGHVPFKVLGLVMLNA